MTDRPTWYLLREQPGWRVLWTDLARVDGAYQLPSVAPEPPVPTATCTVTGCDDLALVDADGRRVLFLTPDGQLLSAVGPLSVVAGDPLRTEPATSTRRLDPTDVLPVEGWPPETWAPTAVAPGAGGHVWAIDTEAHLVHELDRRCGWLGAVDGDRPPPCHPVESEAPFAGIGMVRIGPLDAGVLGCEWDRIAVNGYLPPGGRIDLRTTTSDIAYTPAEVALLDDVEWTPLTARTTPGSDTWDALIHSLPGRFLWVEITLSGDGAVTPRVDDIEVHFPRQTTVQFLPAAYRGGPDGGAFLDQFLALTDTVRRSVTNHLAATPSMLDPAATPAEPGRDFLAWLSGWLGVDDAESLPVARRRRLLAAAHDLYRRRGTPLGVRRHAALWLGRPVEVLEHTRLRRWSVLNHGRLGDASRLFGPDVVRRLQLDENAEIGAVRLIDIPDDRHDPFHFYAHRYSLIVRARRHDDVEDLAERAAHIVSLIAPAHTAAEICVVSPQLRVGIQATLGIDALVGTAPDPVPLGTGRLHQALTLSGDPTRPGPRLGRSSRVSRTALA